MAHHQPEDEADADGALRAALQSRFAKGRAVPPSVDASVFAAFDREVARPVRVFAFRSRLFVAAAAAVLVLLGVGYTWRSAAQGQQSEVAREDFDRSGKVDVLDAYRLALAIRRDADSARNFDLDGDGRVDARDVDLVARRAVRAEDPR